MLVFWSLVLLSCGSPIYTLTSVRKKYVAALQQASLSQFK